MFGLGVPELLIILFIIMLLFGARKLPDLAAGLGGAVSSFKRAMKSGDEEPAAGNVKTIDSRSTASADPVPSTKTETKT